MTTTAGEPAAEVGRSRVRSLSRAIDILDLFNEECPRITLREIGIATSMPKTTVLRHVRSLVDGGLLWDDGNGRYMLGPRLARLGILAERTWTPSPALRAVLAELEQRAHETVHLYVRRDLRRVCIARQVADRPLRHVIEIGQCLPLWGGSAAKVLLAGASDAVLLAVAAEAPPGAPSAEDLRRAAAEAARAGWAASDAELEAGLASVAVPVTGANGTVVAALSFGGPAVRFGADRIAGLVADLQWGAAQVAQTVLPGLNPRSA